MDGWFTDDLRWYVLFGFVTLTYVWIFYQAFSTKFKAGEEASEASETAMLLNPSFHGYNLHRGKPEGPDNPSLFQWSCSETTWMSIILVVSLYTFYYFWIEGSKSQERKSIRIIKFILAWTHSVLLLLFIPINPFHRRILYNLRTVMAQVASEPLKEFFLAFIFIVLLPLPGVQSVTYTTKIEWLALKLGVFYIFQSLLLGSPQYTVEPASEKRMLPENTSQFVSYMALFATILFFSRVIG